VEALAVAEQLQQLKLEAATGKELKVYSQSPSGETYSNGSNWERIESWAGGFCSVLCDVAGSNWERIESTLPRSRDALLPPRGRREQQLGKN
jgi:hypothetical protein